MSRNVCNCEPHYQYFEKVTLCRTLNHDCSLHSLKQQRATTSYTCTPISLLPSSPLMVTKHNFSPFLSHDLIYNFLYMHTTTLTSFFLPSWSPSITSHLSFLVNSSFGHDIKYEFSPFKTRFHWLFIHWQEVYAFFLNW